jgi:hypothetical protein
VSDRTVASIGRMANRENDEAPLKETSKTEMVKVFQTVLVKEIRDGTRGGYGGVETLITIIQRCVLPESLKDDPEFQFGFRANDEIFKPGKRKMRKNTKDGATSVAGTYSGFVRLTPASSIIDAYPFSMHLAQMKLELTSTVIGDTTYRPDLQMDVNQGVSSMLTIKSTDTLDRCRAFDFLPVPVVYGKRENKGKDSTYTPIMFVGFYLTEPAFVATIYMLAPLAFILAMLTAALDWETTRFDGRLAQMAIAIVFTLPRMRKETVASVSHVTATDFMAVFIIAGLAITAFGVDDPTTRRVGIWVAWGSFLLPIIAMVRYHYAVYRIDRASRDLHYVRNKEKEKSSGKQHKEKGEDVDVTALKLIPEEEDVTNSVASLFSKTSKRAPGYRNTKLRSVDSEEAGGVVGAYTA